MILLLLLTSTLFQKRRNCIYHWITQYYDIWGPFLLLQVDWTILKKLFFNHHLDRVATYIYSYFGCDWYFMFTLFKFQNFMFNLKNIYIYTYIKSQCPFTNFLYIFFLRKLNNLSINYQSYTKVKNYNYKISNKNMHMPHPKSYIQLYTMQQIHPAKNTKKCIFKNMTLILMEW